MLFYQRSTSLALQMQRKENTPGSFVQQSGAAVTFLCTLRSFLLSQMTLWRQQQQQQQLQRQTTAARHYYLCHN